MSKGKSLSQDLIIKLLKQYDFPQISEQSDFKDYSNLILALENVNTSKEQYKSELLEVFKSNNQDEMRSIKKKIYDLIDDIWEQKFPSKIKNNKKHSSIAKEQIKEEKEDLMKKKSKDESKNDSNKSIIERIQKKVKKYQLPSTNVANNSHELKMLNIKNENMELKFDPQSIQSQFQQPLLQMCQLMHTMQQQLQQTIELKLIDSKPPQIQAEAEAVSKKNELCKYFPYCKAGNKCQYHHPTEPCKYFPNCPYGNKCMYLHPTIPCKYGMYCQRPDCNYTHPQQANNQIAPPYQPGKGNYTHPQQANNQIAYPYQPGKGNYSNYSGYQNQHSYKPYKLNPEIQRNEGLQQKVKHFSENNSKTKQTKNLEKKQNSYKENSRHQEKKK